jgi:hypothetical protein
MDWGLQNLVQGFLVVGGAGYVVWGAVSGDVVRIGIGVLAVGVGAVGLVRDRRIDVTGD